MSAAVGDDQPPLSRRLPWTAQYPREVDWLLDIPVRPVHALLDDAVRTFRARPFLDFLGSRHTYAQAAQLIAKAAAGFQRLGVRKGTKVGLLLPNSPYSVICYFAILKSGGTVVNYDPPCAEQALIRQITDSETEIMVTLDLTTLYGKVAAARAKTVSAILSFARWRRLCPSSEASCFGSRGGGRSSSLTGRRPYVLRRVGRQ